MITDVFYLNCLVVMVTANYSYYIVCMENHVLIGFFIVVAILRFVLLVYNDYNEVYYDYYFEIKISTTIHVEI